MASPALIATAIVGGTVALVVLAGRGEDEGRTDLRACAADAWDAYQVVLHRSSPVERSLAQDTVLLVDWMPQDWELASVGLAHKDRDRLLGIYYVDPSKNIRPTVVIYSDNIAAEGVSVRSVVWHEFGHRFGRDHSLRPAAHGSVHGGGGHLRDVSMSGGVDQGLPGGAPSDWTSGCPVCLLHDRTALARALASGIAGSRDEQAAPLDEGFSAGDPAWLIHDDLAVAMGLSDGLDFAASVDQRNPLGSGGTIPGIRTHLDRAATALPQLAPLLDPADLATLTDAITLAQADWNTPTPSPEKDDVGDTAVVNAWQAAWAIASWLSPGQATPRLRHSLTEAAALCAVASTMTDVGEVAYAIGVAQDDCDATPAICADTTEAAWWAAYQTTARYFRGAR